MPDSYFVLDETGFGDGLSVHTNRVKVACSGRGDGLHEPVRCSGDTEHYRSGRQSPSRPVHQLGSDGLVPRLGARPFVGLVNDENEVTTAFGNSGSDGLPQ